MTKHVAASGEVTIERPIDEVFAFFADAENDPTWRSGVRSIAREGELGVGAVYRQTVAGPGGRDISANIEVTAFEPPNHVAFRATSGPVRPHGEYRFESVAGGTRVGFSLEAELGGLTAMALAKTVQRTMDAEIAALARAKAHLEGA